MSDGKEAAWYEYKRTHSGLFPDAGLDFAYGYEAGRASRDAEVAESERQRRLWMSVNAETLNDCVTLRARAAAAEAVIAAALEVKPVGLAHWAMRRILRSAPQTVLAERIAQAKAEALEEAARVVRAYPSSHSEHVASILDERAQAAVSHPEPTEEER